MTGLVADIEALLRERDQARREADALRADLKHIRDIFGEYFPHCASPVLHWNRGLSLGDMALDMALTANTPVVRYRLSAPALWAARHPYDLVAEALRNTTRQYLEAWLKEVVRTCPPPPDLIP